MLVVVLVPNVTQIYVLLLTLIQCAKIVPEYAFLASSLPFLQQRSTVSLDSIRKKRSTGIH